MTTAAKFGAQDLTGNPFNYQQVVAPVSSNNVVVNTNFTNRGGADARVRLAATSVPLVSQTVASTQGLQPIPTNASVTSTTVPTTITYTIASTTGGTNILSTAAINVTATTVNTNIITCTNTSSFSIGEAVIFSANFGNLIAGNIYYVLSIPSLTTFTVSSTLGGVIYPLSTAAGSINVQEATTFLQINGPVIFTGGTSILGSTPNGQGFGGIVTGLTYYIQSIPSTTTFTVSTVPSGPAVSLFTATGTLSMGIQSNLPTTVNTSSTAAGVVSNTIQALTISNTTTSTNLLTTASVAVTATAVTTNLITCTSTATLSLGQPIVFAGTTFGNIVAGTIYYVLTINSTTTFTVSSTWNGSVFVLATATGSATFQQSTTNIVVGQPIVFYGTTFGNIVAGTTYYVYSIPSTTTFTVSAVPNGIIFPLLTATGTMITGTAQLPATLSVSNTASTLVTGALPVTATTVTTNVITVSNTGTLSVNQPVVFSGSLGGLVAGTTYYISTIPSTTTFTVALIPNGPVFPLTSATGSITVAPQTILPIINSSGINLSTASIICTNTTTGTNLITSSTVNGLYVGQQVVFGGTTFGGIVSGSQVYYILTINSSTTFTVSNAYNGPVAILSTASGTMTLQPTTNALVPNQPVTVYGNTQAIQNIVVSNTTTGTNVITTAGLAVTTTTSGTNTITVSNTSTLQPGMPVVFSASIGNIVGGTVYYVLSIVNSVSFTIAASLTTTTAFTQSSTAGSVTVQQSTSGMLVNEPIVFNGVTYGGITAGTTYYIQSIVSSTTFTVSTTANGSALPLTTATGTMYGVITPPYYPLTISNTTVTTNLLTTASVAVTATAVTTNLITCTSTATFTVGQPVVFSGNLGNLTASTVYYIQSIASTTTFTVSATLNGPVFALTTASGSINVQQTVGGLTINQPIVFTGTAFGNLVSQTTIYYVSTINSNTTFTVSSTPGGTQFVLATATGTLTTNPYLLGGNSSGLGVLSTGVTYYLQGLTGLTTFSLSSTPGGAPIQFSTQYGYMTAVISPVTTGATNVLTTNSVSVTSTTVGTNLITCSNTTTFAIGQPVVFSGSVGGLVANTVYYILTIPSSTTFTVSATLNGITYALSTATATNITVQQSTAQLQLNQPIQFASAILPLTVSNTSSTGNVITTASIAVTATTVTSNLITCASTATLQIGMPVVFSGSLGNLIAGTVYYIVSVPSTTTFIVSATYNGTQFALASASGSINVQQATSNLAVNQPIIFTGTAFGNIVANTIYYVQSIPSTTTFTVSTLVNGSALVLTTSSGTMISTVNTIGGIVANTTYYVQSLPTLTTFTVSATMGGAPYLLTNATGLMNASVTLPIPQLTISNSTVTTNVYTTASVAVTNTTTLTNVITCTSTATFTIGQPVVFNGALGNLLANTVYYILTIPSSTTFTVSTSLNGPVVALSTATGSINVQQATTNLVINQPVYFLGTAFGNVTSYTTVYYIQSVPSLTTFTISTGYNGTQFVLATATGTMQLQFAPQQLYTVSNTTVTSNLITLYNMPVIATNAGTNTITCNHTYWLQVGMPIVFSATNGGITSGVIYYVQSIVNSTSFTIVQYLGANQVPLTNWNGSMNVQQATTNLQLSQPVVFSGTTFGNIVAGTTYYVYSIPSATTFTVSAAPLSAGGTQFALTTASGLMTYAPLSTNVITYNAINMTPVSVTATAVTTNLITCANTSSFVINQPVVFSDSLGGLVGNTNYYVLTIPSSTTFTVSTTPGGTPYTLVSASGSINVQQSLSNYAVGQPVIFTNAIFPISVNATSASGNTITTSTIAVTNTTTVTNLITCASTATLYINQPVVFSGTIGGLASATVYYVSTIINTTQFTVSATKNGATIALTTDVQSVNVQQATTGLVINQPVVFSSGIGVIIASTTYYVQSIVSATQFTISTSYNGSAFTLTTSSGSSVATFTGLSGTSLNTIYYVQSIPSKTSLMLSTVHGMTTPMILSPSSGSVNMSIVNTVPFMTITNTTVTSNVLTLGSYTASATYASVAGNTGFTLSNVVTVTSTAGLVYGQPIQFTGTVFGGVVLSTTYYVLNVISQTQFTFSATYGGSPFTLSNATGTMAVQPVTTNLIVNQPIVFYGATFGNIVSGTTYYINTIVSTTTFTVTANQFSNTAFVLTTSSGTMTGYYGPIQSQLVYSTNTSNQLQMMGTTVTTTSVLAPNVIGCYNTYHMYVGMPITFSANFSGLIAGTVYYVARIPYVYGFTISTVPGGPEFQLAYATGGSITAYQAITNLWLNQGITFDSGVFGSVVYGNIVAGTTYYLLSMANLYTFVVSTLPGGSAYILANANSTTFASPMIFNSLMNNIPVTNAYTAQTYPITTTSTNNAVTMGQILVNPVQNMWNSTPNNNIPVIISAASGTTNIITCNTTASLSIGLPIVFSSSFAGLQGGTTYYILNILNSTQFTAANSWGGQQVQLNSVTNIIPSVVSLTITASQQKFTASWSTTTAGTNIVTLSSTAGLSSGQQVWFSTSSGNIVNGTTYYVLSVLNSTQITISATYNGGQFVLTSTSPGASMYAGNILTTNSNTNNLYVGLPVVFSGSSFFYNNMTVGTTYYVSEILSSTTFAVAQFTGGPSMLGYPGGNSGSMTMTPALPVTNIGVTLQYSTANLVVGQPIIASGTTFGNIVAGTTYYVQSVLSPTTFTLTATQYSSTQVTLTQQYGYMLMTPSTGVTATGNTGIQSLTPSTPIIMSGATITITNTNGTVLTTTGNTGFLSVNQPVMFTGFTIGGIQPLTYYYVQSILSFNTFTLSATVNGSAISWQTTSNVMTMQIVPNVGTSLIPYNAYYVQAVQTPFTYSISTTQNGPVTTVTNSSGTFITQSNIVTLATGGNTSYLAANQLLTFTGYSIGNIETLPSTNLPFVVTSTTVTSNYITVSNTATLIAGQPIVFLGTTFGGVVAYQTYYVLNIVNNTQFTMSSTVNGPAVTLSTVSGVCYMVPAYYVKAIISPTQFVLSNTPNGPITPIATGVATGGNVLLASGQPVMYDFIEYEALIAPYGVLERTGIILPPNTYLYASSNINQVSVIALGIQEAV